MELEKFKEKNSKKTGIIVFTIVSILLLAGVFFFTSFASYVDIKSFNIISGNIPNIGDALYVYHLEDGTITTQASRVVGLVLREQGSTCNYGVIPKWVNNQIVLDKTNATNTSSQKIRCDLYMIDHIPTGAETILGLVPNADPTDTSEIDNGTDASGCTNTLAYDDFGNLRYVGANPCNYVTFNGEEAGWRIIGVFDNQIKLIRNESIGNYSWDTSALSVNTGFGINQWGESGTYTGADLMQLLNPGYDNNLAEDASGNTISGTYVHNSLYWNKGTGNCYNDYKNTYTTCDFSITGLTESAKTMIANSTWNLGSNDGTNYTDKNIKAKPFYELERSNNTGKICPSGKYCDDTVNRTTTWEGYVGLMYPSDYGYAVGGEARTNCLANTNLYNYNTNNCYTNDWLYKTSTYQWTLSPYAYYSTAINVFVVYPNGHVDANSAGYDYSVRPAFFLIPSIEISGGNGSSTNPYTLKIE